MRQGAVWGLVGACAACAHAPRIPPEDLVSTLRLEAVGPAALASDAFDGKVFIIDFFATWCFPCVQDMPNLEALQRKYGAKGLRVFAVGVDLEGAQVLDPFARHYGFAFPVLVASPQIRDGTSAFGPIRTLPSTLVLSRRGEVLAAYEGLAAEGALERLIQGELGE